MAITITENTTFKHLNGDRSYVVKPGGIGREKEVIVNIAITASTVYATGGITVDFSKVGATMKQVYLCDVKQGHGGFLCEFVPAAGNDSATGKLKFYGIDPAAAGGAVDALTEIADTSALIQGLTLTCIIRGI